MNFHHTMLPGWNTNTSPETLRQKPGFLHLVIKPITKSGARVDHGEFETDIRRFASWPDGIAANILIAKIHFVTRKQWEWPHLHLLFRYSRGSPTWRWVGEFLRDRGYKYAWCPVNSVNATYKYIQEAERGVLLSSQAGISSYTREFGIHDSGHLCEEEIATHEHVTEHCFSMRECADYTEEPVAQSSGAIQRDVDDVVGGAAGIKTKEAKAQLIEQAISTLQPPSISEFKQMIVMSPLFHRRDFKAVYYSEDFDKLFDKAHETVAMQHKNMRWEDLLHKVNVESLRQQHGDYLSPNESVWWIKNWAHHNGININDFVTKLKLVIDKRQVKLNSIQFHADPNSFKTVIATSIAQSCIFYFNNNQLNGRTSQFGLQEATKCRVGLLDEVSIDDMWKEKFLLLLGGHPCNTDKKFQGLQNIARIPILLCYNKGENT